MTDSRWRLVAFDLGGVLVDVDMEAGRQRCAELGYPASVFEAVEASGAKAAGDLGQLTASGMLTTVRAFDPAASTLNLEDLSSFWGATVRWRPFVPMLLKRLRIPTAVLSVIDPIHAAALGPLPGAAPLVYSYRIGALKPDPRAYAALIAESRLAPSRIRYMDDRPENVAGALAAGIDAFLAHGLADLERGLASLLSND